MKKRRTLLLILAVVLLPVFCLGQVEDDTSIHLVQSEPDTRAAIVIECLVRSLNDPSNLNLEVIGDAIPTNRQDSIKEQIRLMNKLILHGEMSDESPVIYICVDSIRWYETSTTSYTRLLVKNGGTSLSRPMTIRMLHGGQSPVITNLDEVFQRMKGVSDEFQIVTKRNDQRQRTASTRSRLQTTPRVSQNLLRPSKIHTTIPRMTAITQFGSGTQVPCLGIPNGLLGVKTYTDPGIYWKLLLVGDEGWNRMIYAGTHVGGGDDVYMERKLGFFGEGQYEFAQPQGIAFCYPYWLAVADGANRRAMVYSIDHVGNPELRPRFTTQIASYGASSLGFVVDVAGASFPDRYGDWKPTLAVLDQDNCHVNVYHKESNTFVADTQLFSSGTGLGQIMRPTSVCFARTPNGSNHKNYVIVTDAGNRRIVGAFTRTQYFKNFDTIPFTFPSDAYLTSVESDMFGSIWVVDSYNSKVYYFPRGMSETMPVVYGGTGVGDGQLLYPLRLKVGQYWNFTSNGHESTSVIGDFYVTERMGNNTGVRKLLMGGDAWPEPIEYEPKKCENCDDMIRLEWFQAGTFYSNITVLKGAPPQTVVHTEMWPLTYPGVKPFEYTLPEVLDPDSTYMIGVELISVFDPNFTVNVEQQIRVNRRVDTTLTRGCQFGFAEYDIRKAFPNAPPFDNCIYPDSNKWYFAYCRALNMKSEDRPLYHWVLNARGQLGDDTIDSWVGGYQTLTTFSDTVYFKLMAMPSNVPSGTKAGLITVGVTPYEPFPLEGEIASRPTEIRTATEGLQILRCDTITYFPLVYIDCAHTTCNEFCQSPPQPGGGCPMLYFFDGQDFELENNILPQSEIEASVQGDKIDFIPVAYTAPVDGNKFKFKVREDEQELSYFDRFGLVALDVAYSAEQLIANDRQELIVKSGQPIMPISAVTNTGQNVLAFLLAEDSMLLQSDVPGYVDLEYRLQTALDRGPEQSVATTQPGGIDPPPEPKEGEITKLNAENVIPYLNHYIIKGRTLTGQYVLAGKVPPRVRRKAGRLMDLSSFVRNGVLKIRLEWTQRVRLNWLPYWNYVKPALTPQIGQLVSAQHSRLGEVSASLTQSGDSPITLAPGEQIELTWQLDSVPDGKQRTFLFVAKGRYEHLGSGRIVVEEPLPKEFAFSQNYPNPFNPSTTFEFALPEPSHVTLQVYNILGQEVTTLVDQTYVAGRHRYHWDGSARGTPLASGVYFAKLVAGEYVSTRKMVVVK